MKSKADLPELEFSCLLAVEKIPAAGMEQSLRASEAERGRLAGRFGLIALLRLEAELSLEPARAGQMVAVKGRMTADVVQQCVVTLEPLESRIEQEIDLLFATPELMEPGAGSPQIENEEIEPLIDGRIDLGELVAQHLGAAIDPYPRKPGVSYVEAEYGGDAKTANPFAQLADSGKKPKD